MTEGADRCLNAARFKANAAENLVSLGWEGAKSTSQAPKRGQSKSQTITKLGVRGTILPSGTCVFRAKNVAQSTLARNLQSYLATHFDGQVTVGSPKGRTGPCDGYTIDAPGLKAWLYFTSEAGDVCFKSGDGSGLTVKLL